jgi:hypothetical protein
MVAAWTIDPRRGVRQRAVGMQWPDPARHSDHDRLTLGRVHNERAAAVTTRRWGGMWVSTFHAACARLLRVEAPRLGYDASFSIYDAADSKRLMGLSGIAHGDTSLTGKRPSSVKLHPLRSPAWETRTCSAMVIVSPVVG